MNAIRKGLAEYSPRIQLVGASFWVAWITLMYSTEPLVPGAEEAGFAVSLAFVVSTLSLSLCLMGASLAPRRVAMLLTRPRVVFASSLAASLGALLIVSAGLTPVLLAPVSAVVTGCATSLIALRTGMLLAEIDTKNMLLSMCGVLALGVLIYSFAEMLALHGMGFLTLAIMMLCLPCSVFVLYLQGADGADAAEEGWPDRPRSLWRLAAYAVVLMFILSVIRGYYPNFIDSAQFAASRGVVAAGLILGAVGVALAAASMPRDASFGSVCYALLFFAVFVSPLMVLVGVDPTAIGNVSAVLFGITMLCIWALSCRISFCSGQSVLCVLGMMFGAACLGSTLGVAVGEWLHEVSTSSQDMQSFGLFALGVCAITALVLLRRSDIAALMQPVEDAEQSALPTAKEEGASVSQALESGAVLAGLSAGAESLDATLRKLCGYVALEHGLTPRETDVLLLLLMGKDAKTMAEELFVSFNTVRSHIRRVYAKLDVHSRAELMAKVAYAAERLAVR